ncbi:hypothetical protein HK097_010857, partial [Rhizophlyctis rosea]
MPYTSPPKSIDATLLQSLEQYDNLEVRTNLDNQLPTPIESSPEPNTMILHRRLIHPPDSDAETESETESAEPTSVDRSLTSSISSSSVNTTTSSPFHLQKSNQVEVQKGGRIKFRYYSSKTAKKEQPDTKMEESTATAASNEPHPFDALQLELNNIRQIAQSEQHLASEAFPPTLLSALIRAGHGSTIVPAPPGAPYAYYQMTPLVGLLPNGAGTNTIEGANWSSMIDTDTSTALKNEHSYGFTTESARTTDPAEFEAAVLAYLESLGVEDVSVDKLPCLDRRRLNLWALFHAVLEHGGSTHVTKHRKWKRVASLLGLPDTLTSASFTLRTYFNQFLAGFEEIFFAANPLIRSEIEDRNREEEE